MRPTHIALRRPLALVLVLVALMASVAAQLAAADGQGAHDNSAEAINQRDGSSVFDFAFSLREVTGGVVDETNTAAAYANCENCQAVAIALQIVLVTGETAPGTVTPTNVAMAINEGCVACQTLALAYQFVIGRGGPVRFTGSGRRALARIRHEFQLLGRSGLSTEEIAARAEALRQQVREVLATEVVPARPQDGDPDMEEDREAEEEGVEGGPPGAAGSPEGTSTTTTPPPADPDTPAVTEPQAPAPEPPSTSPGAGTEPQPVP